MLKAYTRFMEQVHDFIIKVRKGQKDLHEKKAKQEDPFGTKEGAKQTIPKQMQYGKPDDEAVFLSIRKVRHHDEPNDEERMQLERPDAFCPTSSGAPSKKTTMKPWASPGWNFTCITQYTEGAKR